MYVHQERSHGKPKSNFPLSLLMFSNAKNVHISGQPHFVYNDNRQISGLGTESLDEGIRLLLARVVRGAMHNSGERFDAPTCHPETRIALQDDILGWADEVVEDLNEIVTWLYGPAGAGKSAIAQTIAQKLHDQGQLAASFFFSRSNGGEGRGAETGLVATLAYQLSQNVPTTKPHIAATVRENPLVFDLTLQDQVNALVVAPLIAISGPSPGTQKPRVIVVDGLDECRQEKDAHRRVVNALISGLRQIPHHTHKLFITSRPEHSIVSIFNTHEERILRKIEINDRWKPDDDIRTFLNAGFADIRRTHFYFQIHPAEKTWPSLEDIRTLVYTSSGQFIYASVVLKYIKSEENYNPVARLKTLLSVMGNANGDQPYAELDALYIHIFSQIRDVESVLAILSLGLLHRVCVNQDQQPPLSTFLTEVLGLDEGLIAFRLRPLSSLLTWSERRRIYYKHASLVDFLSDETRSGKFYVNAPSITVPIVSQVVKWFEDGTACEKFESGSFLLWTLHIYGDAGSLDHMVKIWTLLSNFNVVEIVLRREGVEFHDKVLRGVSGYLNWIVEQSENKTYAIASSYLSKPVAQILAWAVAQLELVSVKSQDNEQIDLWPFFMIWCRTVTAEVITGEFPLILEILGYPRQRGIEINVPHLNQLVLLCCILPHVRWFYRSDLLGHHAMTPKRFGVALQRTAYYLLQLPEQTLSELLGSQTPEAQYSMPPMLRLIANVLSPFYRGSPLTPDLFFLVALLYPVLVTLQLDQDINLYFISDYIERTVKKYPFLSDPTCEDYIYATTAVRDALIKSKIKTNLHRVAEKKKSTWLLEKKLPYKRLLEMFAVIDSRVSKTSDRIEEV